MYINISACIHISTIFSHASLFVPVCVCACVCVSPLLWCFRKMQVRVEALDCLESIASLPSQKVLI